MFLWQIRKHGRKTNGNKTSVWWLYISRNVPTVGCFRSPLTVNRYFVMPAFRTLHATSLLLDASAHLSPLTVNRSPLSSVSVVGTLRAASVFDTSLSTLILCVRKENIRMVVIYLTQRPQRTRRFNFHTVHAGAGDVASFTTTGERRDRMTNEYSKQLLVSASLCVLMSCVAGDPSQAITFLKFFAFFASSACGNKTSVWWLYISRKERRERGVLVNYCSRWRWRCRKFHCDWRTQRQDDKRIYKQLLLSANLCVLMSRVASDPSSHSVI